MLCHDKPQISFSFVESPKSKVTILNILNYKIKARNQIATKKLNENEFILKNEKIQIGPISIPYVIRSCIYYIQCVLVSTR